MTVFTVLAVTALATNASAWTSKDVNFTNDDGESGRVFDSGGVFYKQLLTNTTGYARMAIGPTYWGYMSVPIDQFDDRTYIKSATVYFYAYGLTSPWGNMRVQLLTMDPRYAGASTIWQHIDSTIELGRPQIQFNFYQYYSVTITGKALDIVRERIEDGEAYLTIGFAYHDTTAFIYQRFSDLHSYIRFQYDDSPPEVTSMLPRLPFINATNLYFGWRTSSDRPTGGNVGGVQYQMGFFLNSSESGNPWYVNSWSDSTSWGLLSVEDGETYISRVRARDASGFTSAWSDPIHTTIDNSPPTVPIIHTPPAYTHGIPWFILEWNASTDAGIGGVTYNFQASRSITFEPPNTVNGFTAFANVVFSFFVGPNGLYHFRVRAIDALGHTSAWSRQESCYQDSNPPTVPVLFEPPLFIPGTSNFVSWVPSYDEGVGVMGYNVQVATVMNFSEGPHIGEETIFTNTTSVTLDDLEDGVTYYYRVRSRDLLWIQSAWSDRVSSTQDASPPTAPMIHPLPEYLPEGPVTLTWSPAIDHGVGISHYEVWWHIQGPPGSSPMLYTIEVIGQSLTFPELGPGKWMFGVYAVDRFGQSGPVSEVNATIDGTPPTIPVLDDVPKFTNGTHMTLRWSPSTDDSGVSHYEVYCHPTGWPEAIRTIETNRTWATFPGLEDGEDYWYSIRAFDVVGNYADDRWWNSEVDASPPSPAPVLLDGPAYLSSESFVHQWTGGADAGIGGVTFRLHWTYTLKPWEEMPDHYMGGDSGWVEGPTYEVTDLEENRTYTFWVVARDAFGHISERSNEVSITIDMTWPTLHYDPFNESGPLSGTVIIKGSVTEMYPYRATISAMLDDGSGSSELIDVMYFDENQNTFTLSWDTRFGPDGDYLVHLGVIDWVHVSYLDEIWVTVRNAHLSMGPTDITFSDPVPEKGDKVTVYVTVRNTGDSAAYDVDVELFDGGVLVNSYDRVILGAHSVIVFPFEVTVEDEHEFTARASSDLYDTFEMEWPSVLEAQEEDSGSVSVGSSVAWVGILAIILAVIAIALNLTGRRGTPTPPERGGEDMVTDGWEETPAGEK